jgi:oligopeptide/dipeptide ABC transporter ATP-binding protein
MDQNNNHSLLTVRDLRTFFHTDEGVLRAVDGVDFNVFKGEILGLVGESGCGKSVTSLSIIRLIDEPGKIVSGEVVFDGKNLLDLSETEIEKVRGKQISMIFQQPKTSLDPIVTIGKQVVEVFEVHEDVTGFDPWEKAVDLLQAVGIPDPQQKAYAYPHELSGGQAQRVMIAIALALNPKLLIADEPTTALDVTIQAQILDLIRNLQVQMGTSVILITHDLGVIAEMADRIAVMYAGRIMEIAGVRSLFSEPLHPYTEGLISSTPVIGTKKDRLNTIPGNVPSLINLPEGCRFASRCLTRKKYHPENCEILEPDLIQTDEGHWVRCWIYQDNLI